MLLKGLKRVLTGGEAPTSNVSDLEEVVLLYCFLLE